MKKAIISLLFLLSCFAWTVRAEEILYIHNSESGEITMISIPGHEIVGRIQIGQWMDYLAASPDGRILYVNRINTFGNVPDRPNIGESGELIAVSTATNEILWRVQLDGMPHHQSVSKDGRYVFVPYYDTWWLAVVDTEKRAVVKKIFIGHGGHGTKLSPDGKRLYVGSIMYHSNYVIFSKDGKYAYVTNRQSNDPSIIDVGKLEEVKRLNLGRYPQRMVIINVPERRSQ